MKDLKEQLHNVRIALYEVRVQIKTLEGDKLADQFMAESAELLNILNKKIKQEDKNGIIKKKED